MIVSIKASLRRAAPPLIYAAPNSPRDETMLVLVVSKVTAYSSNARLAAARAPTKQRPTDKSAPHNTVIANQINTWASFGYVWHFLKAIT